MIGLPKTSCGYPVPACCHGNAVWDLNTSLCPIPACLLSFSFQSSILFFHFLSGSVLTLSRALSLSHVSSGIVVFFRLPPSPCLVLSAKWHFTSCFLLLIPCYFASSDSIKAPVKHTRKSHHRRHTKTQHKTTQLLTVCTHIITLWPDACMNVFKHTFTHTQWEAIIA